MINTEAASVGFCIKVVSGINAKATATPGHELSKLPGEGPIDLQGIKPQLVLSGDYTRLALSRIPAWW